MLKFKGINSVCPSVQRISKGEKWIPSEQINRLLCIVYRRCYFHILLATAMAFRFHLHNTKSVVCKANNQKSTHLQFAFKRLPHTHKHTKIAQAKCRLMHANNICELRKFEYKMVSNQRQRKRQKWYKPKALAYEQIWDSAAKTTSKFSKIFQLVRMSSNEHAVCVIRMHSTYSDYFEFPILSSLNSLTAFVCISLKGIRHLVLVKSVRWFHFVRLIK